MHPLLDVEKRAGPCGAVIKLVEQCQVEHARLKYSPVSPCDALLVQLEKCLLAQKALKKQANQERAQEQRRRLHRAKRLASEGQQQQHTR
jgi:hypothetical protein|eukprot:COSAG01_NODE_8834_length_2643_cov_290.829403_3_plen_90_part_00